MIVVATQKFIRMSPRKLRLVADLVRGMDPEHALQVLPHVRKNAALPLSKVIKTAIANAKDRDSQVSIFKFKEIQIGEGPTLKRGKPVSRGSWHPIKKRMSHIRVVIDASKPEKPSKPSKTSGLSRSGEISKARGAKNRKPKMPDAKIRKGGNS